ncbi:MULTISPECIES: paraquat-inducible protein A [Caballeronia]|jgi:paraquat-inducible protein A|uniref:Paraquat-inducible protein A n=1 Tax=Caballeronia zhejiangensis TaxID=871203 RepID=A0A656QIF9_9BURK|nr:MULTISPECIES: paraquat-inducible protein A [Caballeronia]EKS70143.1 PqiA family integral membrane protein [Burkholderia sp. SJ98]KDR28821.1 paraquat-inducible protein A [Caballeronia zhejiangensis]MCG7400901.1 paraquat-inducible protein A [Caballeronia zhejiangensis]MCI1043407.1 paraquat-inducible protein A [Caballeronia zhejiangensis]MDR5767748.1 paraquat-inducible protein A [Caballeronia sp. LZ028]
MNTVTSEDRDARPLIACHECDLMQRECDVPPGGTLRCCRCRAVLYRRRGRGFDRALAYALAACVLWLISNAFPIVGLAVNGDLVETTLFGAVRVLYRDGMWPLAALIFFTTILMPAVQALGMVWLLLPLYLERRPWRADTVYRLLRVARNWGMTEVLMLGLLVAVVKLAHIASVVTGPALWSLAALMLLLVAASSSFDERAMWQRVEGAPPGMPADTPLKGRTAAESGICVCHDCGLSTRGMQHRGHLCCPRCGAHLHLRKPASLSRTWAYLISAAILYIPANILPVMNTSSLFGAQKDTIMSGVAYLWTSGSPPLAVLVFIASIAVPMLKILAIGYLATSANLRMTQQSAFRARVYRIVEFVGRWSMLDIYVIAVLVALVQFSAMATIEAGPAAIAFGAVVVLTMFAAMSFDPRLIWDFSPTREGTR